ncbi:hypothetical protein CPT32_12975 [Rhizobium sophoriradicis]|nr:hypothetical protein CPT32_12975 [Rhizobium sophoriradicis]
MQDLSKSKIHSKASRNIDDGVICRIAMQRSQGDTDRAVIEAIFCKTIHVDYACVRVPDLAVKVTHPNRFP